MRAPSKLEGKLPEAGKLAVEVVANNINKVEVVAKALGDDFLQEVAANVDVVASVHNSIEAIEAVSTVTTYLPQLTSNLSNLNEVVSNLAPVLNCSNNMATLLLLHARMADLLGVVPQIPNIKVLAGIDDELVGIYEALPQIVTLVEHLDSVSNVAVVLPQLDIIFNNLAELVALGNYIDEIKLVAANMESILEVNELTARVEEIYAAIQAIQSLLEDAHTDVIVRHEDISTRHRDIEAIQANVKVDKDIVAELKDTAIQEAKELHEKAVEDITQITSDAIANMEGISGTTVAELTDIKNTAITATQAIADKAVVDTTDIKNEAISSTQSIRDEAVATTQIIKDTTIREVGILKEDIINTSTNISNNTIDTATHITEKAIADITSIKVEVEGIRDTAIEDIQAIKEEATAEADRAETWANASAVEAGKSEVSAGEAESSATEAKASEVAAKASEVAAKDSEDVAKQKADEAAVSADESEDSSVDSYAYKLSAELSAIAAAASETASKAAETNAIKAMDSSYDYSELARLSANTSEAASADSVAAKDVAVTKATESAASANAAKVSETLSSNSQVSAATSANAAKVSEGNAATSATAAKASETVAVSKAQEAASSATQAKASEQSAATDASKAEEARIAAELAAGTMVGGITDMGAWDASKGAYPSKPTRPMPDGSTVRVSAFWKVVGSGVVSGVEFLVGDDLRYSAGTDEFYKVDNTDAVTSVQGKIGAVTLSPAEVGALEKPSGTFSTNTVLVAGSTDGTSKYSGFTIGKSVPSNAVFTDTVYTHPTSDGNKHVPANGTGNGNKFLMATATAGSYSWMTPTMSHIEGLPAALDAKLSAVANAVSASKLFAPVKINGVSFDGSADITITAASPNTLTRGTGLTGSNYNGAAATTWAVAYGSAAGTACQGNDARLSDARVPKAHTHTIADVTSLQTTLDSKYSASNKPSAGDVGAMAVGDAYLKSEVYTKAEVNSRTDKSIQTPKSLGTEDLDTIKTAGVYAQHANANTSSASHYPENLAGTLIVTSAAGVQQRYHVYNTSRVYTRAQYSSGGWTAWAREYNTLNKPSATDVGAEPQGAVTSHEGKANAHPISGVSGLQAALDAKVPTSRKVNNKTLTGDISLTAADVGAVPLSQSGTITTQSNANYTILADADSSTTTEYASIGAGKNTLKIGSGAASQTNAITYNNNKVYHAGDKPTADELGVIALGGAQKISGQLGYGDINGNAARGINYYNKAGSVVARSGLQWDDSTVKNFYFGVGNAWQEDTNSWFSINSGGVIYANGKNRVYHQGYKPTAADVGAVSKSGDTMTGDLTMGAQKVVGTSGGYYLNLMGGNSSPTLASSASVIIHGDSDGSGTAEFVSLRAGAGTANELKILSKTSSAGVNNSALTFNGNVVYHAGNKPTASDVGALPLAGGTMTGNLTVRVPTYTTSIVDTDNNAPIRMAQINTGSTAGTYFIPLTQQAAQHADGYVTHVTTGLVKGGKGSGWGEGVSGFFVGTGGSDSNATEYFTMAYGGKIKHSRGHEFYSTAFKPTAADVGAVSKSGDTMTGALVVSKTGALLESSSLTGSVKQVVGVSGNLLYFGNSTLDSGYLETKSGGTIYHRNGSTSQRIYTEGFKPTASDVGAQTGYGNYNFGGNQNQITTTQFLDILVSIGAFTGRGWAARGGWTYAANQIINDTGFGNIHLAGSWVEVMGSSRDVCTIRITTATTTSGGTANATYVYVNNGSSYSPGWRRDYNTRFKPTAADVGVGAVIWSGSTPSNTGVTIPKVEGMYAVVFKATANPQNLYTTTLWWDGGASGVNAVGASPNSALSCVIDPNGKVSNTGSSSFANLVRVMKVY